MKNILSEKTNILPNNVKLIVHKTNKRTKLIRWIYEVVDDFEYSPFTYILAINIIDKYSRTNKLVDYQLLGIAALFIAAKLEETELKGIKDYVEVTDNAYNTKEIIQMELQVLEFFDYNMNFVLPQHFYKERWYKNQNIEEKDYVLLLFTIVCTILEKEETNMYFVMESAYKICDLYLTNRKVESKELQFYFTMNEKVKTLLNKLK